MNAITIGLIWLWSLGGTASGWPCPQETDVDGDGRADQVALSMDAAGVRTAQGLIGLPLAPPAVRSICLAELDGRPGVEVLAVAKVATTKDRRLGLRLFVFQIEGTSVRPAFLGSRGGGELLAVGIADLDGDGRAEVLARERDGGELVSRVYRFRSFGLEEQPRMGRDIPVRTRPPRPAAALALAAEPTAEPLLPALTLGFERSPGKIRPVRVKANLAPAANRAKFRWLPRAARRHLARHGFAVLRPGEPALEVHALYLENQYRGLPSYVSADAALHLTHLLFDHALQQIERDVLVPVLGRLVDDWHARASAALGKLSDPEAARAMERILIRLEVAQVLLGAPLDSVKPARAEAVAAEVAAIEATAAKGPTPFRLDYADFVVRGHYTRDALLGRYFRASLFLSTTPTADPVEAAFLVALGAGQPDDLAWLSRIGAHVRALVGPRSGRTPLDLVAELRTAFGDRPTWPQLASKPDWVGGLERSPVSLLPRAWPEDNDLLMAGVDVTERPWPDPLDVLYALGSERAGELLAPEKKRWPPLAERLAKARAKVRNGGLDTRSVGGRWLASLRWLLLPYPKGYAAFQRSAPWAERVMVAAAASWAELRRDTILYVQPPVVWMEGGDEDELPPAKAGFVDPVPELYAELAGVLEGMGTWLSALGPAAEARYDDRLQRKPGPAHLLADGVELLRFLEHCARKELAGGGLTRDEHQKLSGIGTWFEAILAGPGKLRMEPVPVIADVYYFGDPETGVKKPLLIGTGPLDEIVVAVPLGRRTILARGAVSSFWHLRAERPMSDDAWRAMLESGEAPAQPAWARPTTRIKARRRARARSRN